MDGDRFDALTRVLDSLTTRRTTSRALAGGVGLLGLAAYDNVDAKKKKKKCKKPKVKCGKKCCAKGQKCIGGACAVPCAFAKTATLWTLQADCVTNSTIFIPAGVTLDGANKTIRLSGPRSGFSPVFAGFPGIAATDGTANIENLTIDGAGLAGPCVGDGVGGIVFSDTSGQIKDVSIANLARGYAVFARSAPPAPRQAIAVVNLSAVDVNPGGDNAFGGVIPFFSGVDATVTGGEVRRAGPDDFGVWVSGSATATIDGVKIAGSDVGVTADDDRSQMVVQNCEITDARYGVASGAETATVANNVISGRGATGGESAGVWFISGAGTIEGNTISNFFDDDPEATSCGIRIDASAGAVTLGANTFPDPPGNEQDVCDSRP